MFNIVSIDKVDMSQEAVIVGVIANNTPEWLHEDIWQGQDLDFQQHMAECPDEYHFGCWESMGNETVLIGFKECPLNDPNAWYRIEGRYLQVAYKPDETAEYSAIVGEIYTQIVRSNWVQKSAMCSPSYPGQGDLDTPKNSGQWAYALPPSVMIEEE